MPAISSSDHGRCTSGPTLLTAISRRPETSRWPGISPLMHADLGRARRRLGDGARSRPAHMGRRSRDIAELLLAHGARLDGFTPLMLGAFGRQRPSRARLARARRRSGVSRDARRARDTLGVCVRDDPEAECSAKRRQASRRAGSHRGRRRLERTLKRSSARGKKRREPRRATSARSRASRRSRARRLPSRR